MNWLVDRLNDLLKWFFDFFLWLPRKLFSMWCDAVIGVLQDVVPPEAMASLATYFGQLPPGVWWALHQIDFATGMQIIIGSIALKLSLRFVPFLGR